MFQGHESVRLMNDYGAVWPLWWSDGGQVGQDDLPLSPALKRKLLSWAEHFEEHFDPDSGWDHDRSRSAHADQAQVVIEGLEAELIDRLTVQPNLWEL